MAGLLTGDYEAVLQVSEATVNRLLATMHQNDGAVPEVPSFPHSVGLRLGDVEPVDGVRGTAWAQVAVPRIHLVDGATDRFWIEVAVRVRYRPDAGTDPLPEFMYGTVRAQYRLEDIDPNCRGWRRIAPDFLWLRVVEDSVTFQSIAFDSEGGSVPGPVDQATVDAMVTRQLVALLDSIFEPAPHRVTKRFRRGSFISLVQPHGRISVPLFSWLDLPIGGSAVILPVGLTHEPPGGALGSIRHVLLDGRDFAVAVGEDVIMALIAPGLADIRAFTTTITLSVTESFAGYDVYSDSVVYHVSISKADAVWVPQGSSAVIQVTIEGGAHTNSVLPDLSFSVTQRFQLDFDAGAEQVRLWAAGNHCDVHASGVGLPGDVLHSIAVNIANQVETMAKAAAASAQPALRGFSASRADLVAQLRTLDPNADAHLDDGFFSFAGVVLRGWISVSGRHRPRVEFAKIDDDTFSALASWIPGGRIDQLQWSWSWFNNAYGPGRATFATRFVLHRPAAARTKFGRSLGRQPLPGLDGGGVLCLTISGVTVDTTTGALVPVESTHRCTRFGHGDLLSAGGRLLLHAIVETPELAGGPPQPERAERGLVDVARRGTSVSSSANTLVVLAGDGWTDETESTLTAGLAACRRDDAGLLVVVLLPDGALAGASEEQASRLRRLAEELEAPLLVNEDLHGAWVDALSAPTGTGEPAWRLVSPDGGVVWMHDGRLAGDDLAAVLDAGLFESGPVQPQRLEPSVERGALSPGQIAALFDHAHHERSHCPPFNLLRNAAGVMRDVVSTVLFANPQSPASTEELRRLTSDRSTRSGDGGPLTMVVLDGAKPEEADMLEAALGPGHAVLADRHGSIARAFDVRWWPTTVTVGEPAAVAGQASSSAGATS